MLNWIYSHAGKQFRLHLNFLRDPGAASQEEAIFLGKSLQQERSLVLAVNPVSPIKIPSSQLAASGSPRMPVSHIQLIEKQCSSI